MKIRSELVKVQMKIRSALAKLQMKTNSELAEVRIVHGWNHIQST